MPHSVSVAELKKDIEQMPDEQLIQKYGFCKKELEVFLDSFAKASTSKVGVEITEKP